MDHHSGWVSFSSSYLQRSAWYSVMFLGHIALLRLLFRICTAVPNELFVVVVVVCVCVCVFVLHVCLRVPAVLSCFPSV